MRSADRVLVYGGTGAQGRPIVDKLLANGFDVRVPTRDPRNAAVPDGAVAVAGDLDDAAGLRDASSGCRSVVLLLPLAFDVRRAVTWAENAVRAAEDGGVELLLFNTSAPVPDGLTGVAAVDIKVKAEAIVRSANLASIVVRPTLYLDNLTAPWSAPGIVRDRVVAYPLPAALPVAWSTWEGVAACVAAALSRPDLAGCSFDVGAGPAVTGPELAAKFGDARGGEHLYAAIPLAGFAAGLNAAMGEPIGTEIAKLYAWFAAEGREHLAPDDEAWSALQLQPAPLAKWIARQDWSGLARQAT